MGHSVQLVIGKDPAIGRFLKAWPMARAVALNGGWIAIPMDNVLYELIQAATPTATKPEGLEVSPPGLEAALIAATKEGGGLAYVETDYFGGSGTQSAEAFVDGRQVVEARRSRGAGGSINSALRMIGVVKADDMDEFDTIGLGERRSMTDYEPEEPVRLRTAAQALKVRAPTSKHLPAWAVVLVIVLCIAIGWGVAQL